jgi:hypothetical protein
MTSVWRGGGHDRLGLRVERCKRGPCERKQVGAEDDEDRDLGQPDHDAPGVPGQIEPMHDQRFVHCHQNHDNDGAGERKRPALKEWNAKNQEDEPVVPIGRQHEGADIDRGAYKHEIERGSLSLPNRIRPAKVMGQGKRRDADCAERDRKLPKRQLAALEQQLTGVINRMAYGSSHCQVRAFDWDPIRAEH